MHSDSLVDWQCDKCGREFKNVLLPVRCECKLRGLGDRVAVFTKKLGIKECGGCKKRREALNKAFPSKK